MQEKDFYHILEISPDADPAEIKSAYRRLARKYHPDTNKGSEAAEMRIKEINEAYAILGNAEKRKHYDLRERRPLNGAHPRREPYGFGACRGGKGARCMGGGLAACFSTGKSGAARAFRHPFSKYHEEKGVVHNIQLTREEARKGAEKWVLLGRESGAAKLKVQTQARLNNGDFLIVKNGNPLRRGEDIYLRIQLVD